jgi:hypothetical protein
MFKQDERFNPQIMKQYLPVRGYTDQRYVYIDTIVRIEGVSNYSRIFFYRWHNPCHCQNPQIIWWFPTSTFHAGTQIMFAQCQLYIRNH